MSHSLALVHRRRLLLAGLGGVLAACGHTLSPDRSVEAVSADEPTHPTAEVALAPTVPTILAPTAGPGAHHAVVSARTGSTAVVVAPPRLALAWSIESGPHRPAQPVALAASRQGRLYVVDGGLDRVLVFDRDGGFVTAWGTTGNGDGQFRFRRPNRCTDADDGSAYCWPDVGGAVAVDDDERVYIADYGNSRVQTFDHHGRFLARWGDAGDEPGRLLRPQGIAIDGDGRVLVSDTENHRLQAFDRDGHLRHQWGRRGVGAGAFHWPGGLAVDGRGQIYVLDHGNHRLQVFGEDGQYQREWSVDDSIDGSIRPPSGLALDRSGRLYCAGAGGRLLAYDRDGRWLATWGGGPTGSLLGSPRGLTVGPAGDLYLADQHGGRILKLQPLTPMTS